MVPRPTPNALAISATVTSRAAYRARASRTCSGESLAGRPPIRPRTRAAALSAINSRSNSANAANVEDQAPGAGGGIDALMQRRERHPAFGQDVDGLHQMPQ